MNIAYIILAYKLPNQLANLVKRIIDKENECFIHIDKRVNIKLFLSEISNILTKEESQRVHFIKRRNTYWGHYNCVNATLDGLQMVVKSKNLFDYVYFLSGQDYPIKKNEQIYEFLKKNSNKSFMQYFSLPQSFWPNGGFDRLNRYYLYLFGKLYVFPPLEMPISRKQWLTSALFSLIFTKKRVLPYNLQAYGGMFYFCLHISAVNHILDFVIKHPGYKKFHIHTFIPEEIFYQTILLNANKEITDNIVNFLPTYMNWNREPLPAVMNNTDIDILFKSEQLFARKFDANIDNEIIQLIDQQILGIK